MSNKDLDKQEYRLVVEDSEMEVRKDPLEIEGYVLCIKEDDKRFISFPRGTLEELAKTDRDVGKIIIENLLPMAYGYDGKEFFKGTTLNYDSVIAIATKAYLKEQENYQVWRSQQEFENE